MKNKTARLRRVQLDRFFAENFRDLKIPIPKNGWVQEIRQVLGMSAADMGHRLGVKRQRVERLEKDEIEGRVTIETMKKAAEALNCEFIYFLVPKNSLDESIQSQARLAAENIVQEIEHSMALEQQKTSKSSQKELVRSLSQEMIEAGDRRIWKTK